jgi:hypothetical protein
MAAATESDTTTKKKEKARGVPKSKPLPKSAKATGAPGPHDVQHKHQQQSAVKKVSKTAPPWPRRKRKR